MSILNKMETQKPSVVIRLSQGSFQTLTLTWDLSPSGGSVTPVYLVWDMPPQTSITFAYSWLGRSASSRVPIAAKTISKRPVNEQELVTTFCKVVANTP